MPPVKDGVFTLPRGRIWSKGTESKVLRDVGSTTGEVGVPFI